MYHGRSLEGLPTDSVARALKKRDYFCTSPDELARRKKKPWRDWGSFSQKKKLGKRGVRVPGLGSACERNLRRGWEESREPPANPLGREKGK